MPQPERLKQRVLRGAVRENLDTIRGLPPPGVRPSHHVRAAAVRALLVVAGLSLGVVAFTAISGHDPDRGAASVAATPSETFPAPRALEPVTLSLGVRRVVLDPGHGGNDSGARAADVWEKDITLDVARRLRALLQRATYEVAMTRDGDAFVSLRQRAQAANNERADLFLSIHVNSVPEQECHAVETYYLGPAHDPRAERVAGAENRDSGYSLADFRRLLEGVYVNVRQAESRRLAEATQKELIAVLASTNPAIRDKGVRSAPFLVLVATEAPGILAEVSCLSNEEEARRLADPAHRQRIARALFMGVHAYAEARNRTARLGGTPGSP